MYRLMELKDGPKRLEYYDSWVWGKFLQQLQKETVNDKEKDLVKKVVPVRAFRHVVLREVACELLKTDNLLSSCEVVDYKNFIDPSMKMAWFAKVLKVAGYRALCQWIGHEANDPYSETFWIHMGSPQFQSVDNDDVDTNLMCFMPPQEIELRWRGTGKDDAFRKNLKEALKETETMSSFNPSVSTLKSQLPNICVFKIGQRLEMLDYQNSYQVRPARIMDIIGRRVCVQVTPAECPDTTGVEEDKQYGDQLRFWVDQASFYLFHVGWALYNGYQLKANKEYVAHAAAIAKALKNKQRPNYDPCDVTREVMQLLKPKPTGHEHKWTVNTVFEFLDPLESKVRDLRPAKVVEILKDNYLKVLRIGSPEDEIIPLHASSSYLFPIEYGSSNRIKVIGPENEGEGERFSWFQFTSAEEWAIVPDDNLFKKDPSAERKKLFVPGAKLEAADLCDNYQICPATILSLKGRLLHIEFDGWGDDYDIHVDIDSPDIFPIGWCELMGCKLDWPNDEYEKKMGDGDRNKEIKEE